MRKFKIILCFCASLMAFVCIFAMGDAVTGGLKNGLILCSTVIIPSLFPFMTVCSFLERSGLMGVLSGKCEGISRLLFRLPGCAFCVVILSLFAGYPVGARMIKSMHQSGDITLSQGKKMCLFCIGAGPAFLVIAVGCTMLHSKAAGWMLAASHLISAIITALILGRTIRSDEHYPHQRIIKSRLSVADSFVESVASSTAALISVCAYTVLFSGVVEVMKTSSGQGAGLILTAITEVSSGCAVAAETGVPISVFAAITGFGGISVICQVMSCAGKCRPNFVLLVAVRLFNAAVSYIICELLLKLFPVSQHTFSTFSASVPMLSGATLGFPVAFLIFCTVFLFSTYQKSNKRLVDFF